MRFLLDGATFSNLASVLPMVLLTAFVPSLLAWAWSIWVSRRDGQQLPWRRALGAFVTAFAVCFATLSWTPGGYDYVPAQVIVSGLAMVIVTVLFVYKARPKVVASVLVLWGLVLGYSLAWAFIVGWSDITGLWGVGLIMLYSGLLVGLVLVIAVVQIVSGFREAKRLQQELK